MANYRRNFLAGGTYFFTVVTHRRRSILTSPTSRGFLRNAFRTVRKRKHFMLDAIVLLPDHLLCVWTLPNGDVDYPNRWRQIKSSFTRSFISSGGAEAGISKSRLRQGDRGVWQRRFYEHTIRDETDLKRCTDYIHLNPVKHGLVERVKDWPWSSFFRYVKQGEYEIEWGGSTEMFGDEWTNYE